MTPKPFDPYRSNRYSQNGEDGVLFEIISNRLKMANVNFVEVGAWDGIYLSNTRQFHGKGEGLLIERDAARYAELLKNTEHVTPRIRAVHAEVTVAGEHSLDSLIKSTGMPDDIALLSIDLDGPDHLVWEGMSACAPAVVVIEVYSNPRPGVRIKFGENGMRHSSFSTTLDLGVSKGYTLVCHTGNMIFLRNDLVDAVGMPREFIDNPDLLFDPRW